MLNFNHLYTPIEQELRANLVGKFTIYYSVTPSGEITREIPCEILDVVCTLDKKLPEACKDETKVIQPLIQGCHFKLKVRNLLDNSEILRDTRCFTSQLFDTAEEVELLTEFNNKQRVIGYDI